MQNKNNITRNQQISLFADGDIFINDNCKKISPSARDLFKKKAVGGCPYMFALGDEKSCCLSNDSNACLRVLPELDKCGTPGCPYYIEG